MVGVFFVRMEMMEKFASSDQMVGVTSTWVQIIYGHLGPIMFLCSSGGRSKWRHCAPHFEPGKATNLWMWGGDPVIGLWVGHGPTSDGSWRQIMHFSRFLAFFLFARGNWPFRGFDSMSSLQMDCSFIFMATVSIILFTAKALTQIAVNIF